MSAARIRELRVTDIRCRRCDAEPGEACTRLPGGLLHLVREQEHAELVAAGWHWQEVDTRDDGAPGWRWLGPRDDGSRKE